MKKIKKILAALLTMTLVLGMGVTVSAENGIPEKKDTTTVQIKGLEGKPTVTLYQVATGVYGDSDEYFVRYQLAENLGFDVVDGVIKPTTEQIDHAATELQKGEKGELSAIATPVETWTSTGDTDTTYTSKKVGAGLYLAVISGAEGYTYNPILLTATYGTKDHEDDLVGGVLDLMEDEQNGYLHGSTATAKKSKVGIEKTVSGTSYDADKDTNSASVGDVLTYAITPTMPSYPAGAVNKTFFVSDTMSAGQTFLYDSLEVRFKESAAAKGYIKDADGKEIVANVGNGFKVTLAGEERTVAAARATIEVTSEEDPPKKVTRPVTGTEKATGFYLNFDYDKLTYDITKTEGTGPDETTVTTTGYTYIPVVTYKAVLNEDAVVGGDGNTNKAKLYYSNQPNNGSTHTGTDEEPDPGNDPGTTVTDEDDSKVTVYTYQLAFHKVGDANDTDKQGLKNAVFGIYKTKNNDGTVDGLVDTVITNDKGYAVSGKVGAGTYYIKEMIAPSGYSLNDKVYSITVQYSTATTKTTTTKRTYTTDAKDKDGNDLTPVGWMKDGVFYSEAAYAAESEEAKKGYQRAYLLSSTATTTESLTEQGSGTAAVLLDENGKRTDNITNTKLSALPSTGGVGTTIFTVGGCALMIVAAGLYFATRRKNVK